MDAFSYLSVLISIILGLAITEVLQGLRGLVIARARVRMYWPSVAWAVLTMLVSVQSWWAMFGMRHLESWSFVQFAVVLVQVIATYMLAALVLPDFEGDHTIDLRTHYFRQVRWFSAIAVCVLLASLAKDLVLSGHLPAALNVGFHLFFMAIWLGAALTRRDAYHYALPLLTACAFCAYIVLLFARLQ